MQQIAENRLATKGVYGIGRFGEAYIDRQSSSMLVFKKMMTFTAGYARHNQCRVVPYTQAMAGLLLQLHITSHNDVLVMLYAH